MSRTFADHYRCPEEFTRCFMDGETVRHPGHFRFGPEAICYGSLSKGTVHRHADGELYDALKDAAIEGDRLRLPFNPDEVVDNLRTERYCGNRRERSLLSARAVRHLYYLARPFLGVAVRRQLQKLRLADWKTIRFPRWPVDRTVEQIHETMLRLRVQAHEDKKVPFIWFWPQGFTSCAIVTHDVETAQGRDFCGRLMDIDDSFAIKSSFQLIPEERYQVSPSFIDEIRSRKFEANVHDLNHDGWLFDSKKKFLARARRINHYLRVFGAQGFRSGALCRNVDWYGTLEFSYDMSVPNTAHLDPQRGGCCTVMPYFIGNILELPVTTTQDYSLFHILGEYSIDLWKRQIAAIMEKYGLISFIVHPDYITESREQAVYKMLLAYLSNLRSERKVWIALPGEVNQWWRARNQMKLVRRGREWTIEGPERDRARVAVAVIKNDRLEYDVFNRREKNSSEAVASSQFAAEQSWPGRALVPGNGA